MFETGELRAYDDLTEVEARYNPESSIRSEILVPLGKYGVLLTGSTSPRQFSETDIDLFRILGATVEAALVRVPTIGVGRAELLNPMTASNTVMSATNTAPIRLESREELEQLVAEHDRVLVDFYTRGCPICQSIEPVMGNVAKVSDVTVAMLNPRESPGLIEEFNIRSVPTLVLFEDGDEVDRMAEGFRGTDAIVAFVDGER